MRLRKVWIACLASLGGLSVVSCGEITLRISLWQMQGQMVRLGAGGIVDIQVRADPLASYDFKWALDGVPSLCSGIYLQTPYPEFYCDNLADGPHAFEIKATDKAGRTASASVTFTV